MTPSTFKEALKARYATFLIGSGVAIGLGVLLIVAILTWGGWPSSLYGDIVHILGRLATGGGVIMILVIIFLGLGGSAQSIKGSLWGASIETQGDECSD